MAFSADFTISQSADGKTITFTDTSNYGDTPTSNKGSFTTRVMYLTFPDSLSAISVAWPFENLNNSIQDTLEYVVDMDKAFVARLELTESLVTAGDILYREYATCLTEYTEAGIKKLLSSLNVCECKNNRLFNDIAMIEVGKMSALNRADRGDIVGASKDIYFVQERLNLLLG